jgi:hypothetical protein
MLTTEIEASRCPLSPRITVLKEIREKLRGEESAPAEPRRVVRDREVARYA